MTMSLMDVKIFIRTFLMPKKWRARAMENAARRAYNRHAGVLANVSELPVVKNDKEEKIFSIWLQGEDNAPPLVHACYDSIRRNCTQDLIVLDEKTLPNYIDLPGYVYDKYRAKKMRPAHFADIARVELLHNHGGIWMDATVLSTAPIPKDIIAQDFFVFLAGAKIYPHSFMQNCFIRARKNAYLLAAWRALILDYWKTEPRYYEYFMHQTLFKNLVQNDPRAAAAFAKMPHITQEPIHSLWYGKHYGVSDFDINAPFNRAKFDAAIAETFIQKTSHKEQPATNPIPGSTTDMMMKRKVFV